MLSKADSVPAQGVGSAFLEQFGLVKELSDFEFVLNSPKKKDIDINHIHSVNLRYRLRMNKKQPNIVSVHFVPKENKGSVKLPKLISLIFDKYVERFYKNADELVVVNPCFITPLEDLGIPTERITYIPNYVSKEHFYPLSKEKNLVTRKEYGLGVNDFVVLGCGQIQTRKGFDDFCNTAINNPDMKFVWSGGFSFGRITHGYHRYKKMMKNLPKNMICIGIVDRKKMNEIFNASDCLFMPSLMELFPMSILEACNAHKPILLRDIELYKPILFDKYCSASDIDSFSKELVRLKSDSDYYLESQKKSIYLSEFYSKDNLLKQWNDYYLRIYQKYQ